MKREHSTKMKTRKQFLTTLGLGMAGVSLGHEYAPLPLVPTVEFAFTAHVSLGTVQDVGETPHGHRRIIPITGGTFEGPAIKGTVEPGGADWQIIRHDQVVELEAKYTLKTNDGVFIYVINKGYRHGPQKVLQRISAGEVVDPSEYYFRTSATFETASGKYADFNKFIFISSGERNKDSAVIHFYKIQ